MASMTQAEQLQEELSAFFDSVEETRDDTLIARVSQERCGFTQLTGEGIVKTNLFDLLPTAKIINSGRVQDSRRTQILQWWVEFVLEEQ